MTTCINISIMFIHVDALLRRPERGLSSTKTIPSAKKPVNHNLNYMFDVLS